MKKSFLRNILCLLVLVCLALSVSAAEYMSDYLSDSAGYLTDEQAQTLDSALEQASKELTVYIRIATEKTMSGSSPEETAGDYYDYFNDTGDGYLPGILLYVCRDDYTYYVTASDNVFNDEMISTLEDSFVPYLSDDDYLGAFNAYLDTARELIVEYHGSSPNFPDDPYSDSDTVTDTIPNSAFVYDYAGYLTDEQAETLETELSQAADALTAYIRIVTEDEMSEYSKEMAAKTYYDALNDTGSGELPGILLYVCRSERVYYLEASDNVFNDEMITNSCRICATITILKRSKPISTKRWCKSKNITGIRRISRLIRTRTGWAMKILVQSTTRMMNFMLRTLCICSLTRLYLSLSLLFRC